jgi:ketol-acid reductoisomerase
MLTVTNLYGQDSTKRFCFEFYEGTFNAEADTSFIINTPLALSAAAVKASYTRLNAGKYQTLVNALLTYKEKHQLNDWLYYQLIRKTAQQISPKDRYKHFSGQMQLTQEHLSLMKYLPLMIITMRTATPMRVM